MRLLSLALLVALSLSTVADRPVHSASKPRSAEVQRLIGAAVQSFVATDYARARENYTAVLHEFDNLREYDRASVLIGLGNCDMATRRYTDALRHYEAASKIADAGNFIDHQMAIATNTAAVYRRMADSRSAQRAMQTIERLVPHSRNPLVVAQSATVIRDVSFDRSMTLYARALDLAASEGDRRAESIIWNQVGTAFEEQDRFTEADRAFTEAFRIRLLTGRKHLQPSYFYLGRLRWKQGDYRSAIRLLEIARDLARTPEGQIQLPYVHHALARACYSDGQIVRALAEYESAVRTMREWRLQVLPAQSFRVTSETFSQQIFADYVDAGMALHRRTGNAAVAARMLEVAEDSRSWLAQQTLVEQKELPSEYLETLAKYRRALALSLGSTGGQVTADAEKYRLQLSNLEAQLGIETEQPKFSHQIFENVDPGEALRNLRRKLRPSEAFLSFHSGPGATYVWAVTSDSFEAHRIAGRSELQSRIAEFRTALFERRENVRRAGQFVAQAILGPLSPGVRERREWILSLDGPLFDVPFAALPEGNGWLGERHALRLSSSALLNQAGSEEPGSGEFVAMADPVYNRADPRRLLPAGTLAAELPRLPGTAREAESCARAWGRDQQPRMLTGTEIGREELIRSIAGGPAVLHVAAHVIPHPTFPDQVLVALGLQPSGQMEYLAPADVAFNRLRVGLVTLSGCGSGRGSALPGLGLFGLTRAWLMAGATTVVASQWPIADDSGELLASMYERLGQTTDRLTPSKVADALQAAQRRMIQAGGWRSDPVYWSAFVVSGKD